MFRYDLVWEFVSAIVEERQAQGAEENAQRREDQRFGAADAVVEIADAELAVLVVAPTVHTAVRHYSARMLLSGIYCYGGAREIDVGTDLDVLPNSDLELVQVGYHFKGEREIGFWSEGRFDFEKKTV